MERNKQMSAYKAVHICGGILIKAEKIANKYTFSTFIKTTDAPIAATAVLNNATFFSKNLHEVDFS